MEKREENIRNRVQTRCENFRGGFFFQRHIEKRNQHSGNVKKISKSSCCVHFLEPDWDFWKKGDNEDQEQVNISTHTHPKEKVKNLVISSGLPVLEYAC